MGLFTPSFGDSSYPRIRALSQLKFSAFTKQSIAKLAGLFNCMIQHT